MSLASRFATRAAAPPLARSFERRPMNANRSRAQQLLVAQPAERTARGFACGGRLALAMPVLPS